LNKNKFTVQVVNGTAEDGIAEAKKKNVTVVSEIPAGFEESIKNLQQKEITNYTILKNFSVLSAQQTSILKNLLAALNNYTSNQIIVAKTSFSNPELLKNPIKTKDIVLVGSKRAEVAPEAVINFIMQQTTFIPIILFIVIIFSATMIATTMASEKENKTLETLLTVPVNRRYIVLSKMMAAGLVSLVSAAFYMFGFRSYINGLSGGAMSAGTTDAVKTAVNQLGLTLGWTQYALLGVSLFFGILVALAIAMILGVFAEDVKSVNGIITPLMFLVLIPYFLTMFLDINSLSNGIKWAVFAIPFSHPFLAAPNLFLGNYMVVIYGIVYEAIVFLLFLSIATWIFSTDKIVTVKLNFNKKKILSK
jgi:ABC-2 type transport system permease protein